MSATRVPTYRFIFSNFSETKGQGVGLTQVPTKLRFIC